MYTWVTLYLSRNRTLKQTTLPMWPIDRMDDMHNVNECHLTFFATRWDNYLKRTHLSIKIEKHCHANTIFGHFLIKKFMLTPFSTTCKHANSKTKWKIREIFDISHSYTLMLLLKIAQHCMKTLSASQNLNPSWVKFLMWILLDM